MSVWIGLVILSSLLPVVVEGECENFDYFLKTILKVDCPLIDPCKNSHLNLNSDVTSNFVTSSPQLSPSNCARATVLANHRLFRLLSLFQRHRVTTRALQRHSLASSPSAAARRSTVAFSSLRPLSAMPHVKCRNASYPRDASVVRTEVPDAKVDWSVDFPEYKPIVWTLDVVLKGPVWADPDILTKPADIKYNQVDGKVDRRSFTGEYKVDQGLPLNPMGRTGIKGRGALGRWGPNHAADPIVTRWKKDGDGKVVQKDGKPVLQFVSILRGDTKEWAIPGGMVDPGEEFSATLKREFSEEAMNGLTLTPEERAALDAKVAENFTQGKEVYRGYVDDPRNTDNAWMETVAVNFHDEKGDGLAKFDLHAGDDAVGVRWTDLDSGLKLYASHFHFVEKAAKLNGAHW